MEHKVLFTASTFSHIFNFHLPYLRAFHEHGWIVHVACGGEIISLGEADKTVFLPITKKMFSYKNLLAARILRQEIEKEHYDLVYTHTSLAAFFSRLAVFTSDWKPKVVNMVHGYLFDDDTAFIKKELLFTAEKMFALQTDLVLTMNRYDTDIAERFHLGKKVKKIPGVGVDFSRFSADTSSQMVRKNLNISDDAFVMIYPAEFSKRKNQQMLIRSMTLLPHKAILVLPGEGKLINRCRILAKKIGVSERVVFPGYIRDIGPWYKMADVAVSASRSEGLPFNIIEAMFFDIPVVASAVKGHVDLINPEKNGLLFPFDDYNAFSKEIKRLIASPEMRKKLGDAAVEEAKKYSLEMAFPEVWRQLQDTLLLN